MPKKALKCKKNGTEMQENEPKTTKTAEKFASYRKKSYLCSAIVQNE